MLFLDKLSILQLDYIEFAQAVFDNYQVSLLFLFYV